jgi:hypothetical protein
MLALRPLRRDHVRNHVDGVCAAEWYTTGLPCFHVAGSTDHGVVAVENFLTEEQEAQILKELKNETLRSATLPESRLRWGHLDTSEFKLPNPIKKAN